MARKTSAQTSQFPDRVRFNWGYHDGAVVGAPRLDSHYDRFYLAGYRLGQRDRNAGGYDSQTATSDAAWGYHVKRCRERFGLSLASV